MTELADYVLYDGQCPVCSHYIAASRIGERRPDVRLIDARSSPDLVKQHGRAGRAIDDGMIVVVSGASYHGVAATEKIADLGMPATRYARCLLWTVGRAPWSRGLYPVLAAGRRILLRRLGRDLIGCGAKGT
jgi:predicted DCC family thiol-disulfide oxidoreductase YuxK